MKGFLLSEDGELCDRIIKRIRLLFILRLNLGSGFCSFVDGVSLY